jgi:hypothetical protein
MRSDVYGAQIGARFEGMPFLQAASIIYKVGRCRSTLSNPVLKALTVSTLETGIS